MIPLVTYIFCPITDIYISRALYTLYKYQDPKTFKVVVIDQTQNGFRKEVMDYISPLVHLYIRPRYNLGFSKAMNEGAIHGLRWGSKYICLANDDIEIINSRWFQGIEDTFAMDERIIGVIPMSTRAAGWGYGESYNPDLLPYKKEYTEEEYDYLLKGDFSECKMKLPKTFPRQMGGAVVDGAVFIMLYLKKEAFEKVGFLDEHFWPGCFLPNEQVLMGNLKYKAIKDIKEGELVIGKTGKRCPVNRIMPKPYKGKVLELSFVGTTEKVKLTPDHKVFAVSKTGNKGKRSVNWSRIKKQIKEVEASKLLTRDLVYCPRLYPETNTIGTIEEYRIYGYFLAEGNYINKNTKKGRKRYGISFNFNINEKEYVSEVFNYFRNEGFNPRVKERPKKTITEISIYSKEIANKFFNLFGEYSYGKSIPPEIMLADKDLLRNLVIAYSNGDGGMCREFKKGYSKKDYSQMRMKSVSTQLIMDIRNILLKLGIPSLLYIKTKAPQKGKRPAHELYISQNYLNRLYSLPEERETWQKAPRNEVFEENSKMFYPIKGIKELDYEGEVYDLEVGIDHSYIVGIMTVHNSGEDVDYCARAYIKNYRIVSTSLSWIYHWWTKSKDLFASGELENKYHKPDTHNYWCNMGDLWPPSWNEGNEFDVWGFYHKTDEKGNDIKIPLKRVKEVFVDQIH